MDNMEEMIDTDRSAKYCYIEGIDGLRAIVILIIVAFYHYRIYYGCIVEPHNIVQEYLCTYGNLGVEVFFCISGFMARHVYFHEIERHEISWSQFLMKRVCRLYPAMAISVITVVCIQWAGIWLWGDPIFSWHDISVTGMLLNLLGLQAGVYQSTVSAVNGPTWFISVLMVCYLLFYWGAQQKDYVWKFGFIILLGISLLLNDEIQFLFLFHANARGYISFFIGVLLYQMMANGIAIRWGGGLLFIAVLCIIPHDIVGNRNVLMGILGAPSLLYICMTNRMLKQLLEVKIIKMLGRISFSVFVWHMPVMALIKLFNILLNLKLDFSSRRIWVVVVLIVVIFSAFFKYMVEDKISQALVSKGEG